MAGVGAPEVASATLWRVALPLRHAHRAAHGSEAVRQLVLVEVHLDDGTAGWGECSALARPSYTSEYTAGAWALLRDELVPAVLAGRRLDVVGHPMATAAVVTAVSDAVLRSAGRSLATDLAAGSGGNPQRAVRRTAVIGLGDPAATVEATAAAVEAGAVMVKLKVTAAEEHLRSVAAVRDAWPELSLAVDFNGTADLDALRRIDCLGLAYVEQPAPADALVTSAHLAARIDAPVALDESVGSVGELDAAVALGAGRIVNVKPARCGGPHGAAALVVHARHAGIDVFVGGMVESGVGRAAALAVAALPGIALPTDLGPSAAYVERDVTAPIEADDQGRTVVPDGPGIGRVPDPAVLDAVAVERIHLGR